MGSQGQIFCIFVVRYAASPRNNLTYFSGALAGIQLHWQSGPNLPVLNILKCVIDAVKCTEEITFPSSLFYLLCVSCSCTWPTVKVAAEVWFAVGSTPLNKAQSADFCISSFIWLFPEIAAGPYSQYCQRYLYYTAWKTSRRSDGFSMLAVFLYFTPPAAIDRPSGVEQTLLP